METGFEMRASLAIKEPKLVEKWANEHLYKQMNEVRKGREYVLHDGPPYANGDIHCGHMLNRLLKDFVIRYKNMRGYKTPFVFGWDTHGLPIETAIAKTGVDRKKMKIEDFRDLCKNYALKQVAHQKEQIQRLGCLGDYSDPYLTLNPEYEARQIEVFAEMALQGIIYKGLKPVYWSPSSESALAEAEVEYQDIEAKTIYFYFDLESGNGILPDDAKALVWTTTPWTIPADQAIALNPRFDYGLYETEKGKFLFLVSLEEKIKEILDVETCSLIKKYKGQELEGIKAIHPLYPNKRSPFIVANYVTEDSGTGLVHIAPDFGTDDFIACLKYGIKPFQPIDERGYCHYEEGDPLNGLFYEESNDVVIDLLTKNGHLLKEIDIVHSYPHDWRTHKPVIYRATPQWFCSISPIKEKLLEEIKKVEWKPAWGYEKMVNMVKDRSDWCISRQRAWGVPIPIIYNEDDTPIIEKEVFDHIRDIIRKEGSNGYFVRSAKELLPEGYTNSHSPNGEFHKETDIMDVWFDSGSSWHGVLEERGLTYPADLYLEGNDQYRGWFNASLTLSTAYNGVSPFKKCLTHGWVMDENWQKMSKSKGNGIDPSKVANMFGADILRLWASSVNYASDVRISESIIATISDQYRKIRNTFRFLLGNLHDGNGKAYEVPEEVPELFPVDKWILGEFEELKENVLSYYEDFAFPSVNNALTSFMVELSSFYLDIQKDVFYCEGASSKRRKAAQYVAYTIAKELMLLFEPILPFTMDEAYSYLPMNDKKISPQLEEMPEVTHLYADCKADYEAFMKLRSAVLKALENERALGHIGSALEAHIEVSYPDEHLVSLLKEMGEEESSRLFGVSEASFKVGEEEIKVVHAEGESCARCRKIHSHMHHNAQGEALCDRCSEVLEGN